MKPAHLLTLILLPHLQGNEGISSSNMMRYTIANVEFMSNTIWVHFVLVYVIIAWAMLLMRWHFKQYVIVRQHYLERGDDPDEWRMLFETSFQTQGQNKLVQLLDSIAKMSNTQKNVSACASARWWT